MSAKTQYTSLSEELYKEANASLVSTSKIGLSYKMIKFIGLNIPNIFFNVSKLYLSNNKIRYLTGIEVFKNLVFFSVTYNEIDNIEEFEKINNKGSLISLAVKGNLFYKNPSANLILIQTFPNLKDLDGYKVSEGTIKTIDEENINKLKILVNQILINIEIESRAMLSEDHSDEKIQRINKLLKIHGFVNFNAEKIRRYLKKNINPSIYVIKKFIDSFISSEDYLYKNFCPPDINSVAIIYEKLFFEIIKTYTIKKNYNELPAYLNYLILNSNPILKKFFLQKVRESKDFHNYIRDSMISDKKGLKDCECIQKNNGTFHLFHENCLVTEMDILKFTCRNFDRYFVEYSNYGIEILIRLQMYFFYNLQPPQAKVFNPYQPILELNNSKFIRTFNINSNSSFNQNNNTNYQMNKNSYQYRLLRNNITMSEEYEKYHKQVYTELKYKNPFLSRLHSDADIKPKKPKLFSEKNTLNKENLSSAKSFLPSNDFSNQSLENAMLDIFYEEGKEKINLNFYVQFLTSFFCNYSPLEIPVFCLNFDYMRVLSTLIQNKLEEFLFEYTKLDKIYIEIKLNYEDFQRKQINKNSNFSAKDKSMKEKTMGTQNNGKTNKNSNSELFYLTSNIFNDNKFNNTNNNNNLINTNNFTNNESSNRENNINSQFYVDNYCKDNFIKEEDLQNTKKISSSSEKKAKNSIRDLSQNNAFYIKSNTDINCNDILGKSSYEQNKNINQNKKLIKNEDNNNDDLSLNDYCNYNYNEKSNKSNTRYFVKLGKSENEKSDLQTKNNEDKNSLFNTSNKKTIYYHTFSNNMNSLQKSEEDIFNKDSQFDFNQNKAYLFKGNTDFFNRIKSHGNVNYINNNLHADYNSNLKKDNFELNNENDIQTNFNNSNYVKFNAVENFDKYNAFNPQNNFIDTNNNINNKFRNNINHFTKEPLNIKEKLLNNLGSANLEDFNKQTQIQELSTLQSNEYKFGDSIYNEFSSRLNRGSNERSPRFIQSLDSEINSEYINRLEKQIPENSTINSNHLQMNYGYSNRNPYNYNNEHINYNESNQNINFSDNDVNVNFVNGKKYENYNYAGRIIDAGYILVYFFRAHFSKIIFDKLKLNYLDYRLKYLFFVFTSLLRKKEKKIKNYVFEELKLCHKYNENFEAQKIDEFKKIKEIIIKKNLFQILFKNIWRMKHVKMLRNKILKRIFIKLLKNNVILKKIKTTKKKSVKEIYAKNIIKKIFSKLKQNISKRNLNNINNDDISKKEKTGDSILSKFENSSFNRNNNLDYYKKLEEDKKLEFYNKYKSNEVKNTEGNYNKIYDFFHGKGKDDKNLDKFSANFQNEYLENNENFIVKNSNPNNNGNKYMNNQNFISFNNLNNNVSDTNIFNLIDNSKLSNENRHLEVEKEFENSHSSLENPYKFNYEFSRKPETEHANKKEKELVTRESIGQLNPKNDKLENKLNEIYLDSLLNKAQAYRENLSNKIFKKIFFY